MLAVCVFEDMHPDVVVGTTLVATSVVATQVPMRHREKTTVVSKETYSSVKRDQCGRNPGTYATT